MRQEAPMSDNPLEMTPEREARIRERAYHLWEADGRPHGRETEFWERASELIGMEDHAGAALKPNPMTRDAPDPGDTVEEAAIQENYGEFPDRLADQGEWRGTPMTKEQERRWAAGKLEPSHGDTP
jgi:Protein of unknown function (DUF2934)